MDTLHELLPELAALMLDGEDLYDDRMAGPDDDRPHPDGA